MPPRMSQKEVREKVAEAMRHLQSARAALNSYGNSFGGMSESAQLRMTLREEKDADHEIERALELLNPVQVAHQSIG
jgi:hypothetical protein